MPQNLAARLWTNPIEPKEEVVTGGRATNTTTHAFTPDRLYRHVLTGADGNAYNPYVLCLRSKAVFCKHTYNTRNATANRIYFGASLRNCFRIVASPDCTNRVMAVACPRVNGCNVSRASIRSTFPNSTIHPTDTPTVHNVVIHSVYTAPSG